MRTILILLAMTGSVNAMSLTEAYLEQSAVMLTEKAVCPNKFRYYEYMTVSDKLSKALGLDFVATEQQIREKALSMHANGFRPNCNP